MMMANVFGVVIGTYQVRADRVECDDSDKQWEIGDGDVAGNLVFGVSGGEASEEGCCYDTGGESLRGRLAEGRL
jgi:hypothetical protein